MTLAADTDEPEILYNKDYTKQIQRWNLSFDIPDDGMGPINAFLVTATVKPKKKNSTEFYPEAILGFAVPHDGDLSDYVAVEAYDVEPHGGSFKFKFKEKSSGTKHEKQCTIDLGPMIP